LDIFCTGLKAALGQVQRTWFCYQAKDSTDSYAARAVDCVSNGLENQKRVEKGFLSGGFNGWTVVLGFIIFRGPFEICYVFFCSFAG
jgi:hypothetical protein